VDRGASFEERGAAPWLRSFLLPALVWIVAVAIMSGLVFGGVVGGGKTYVGPGDEPTTQPTVLIEPRAGKRRAQPGGMGAPARRARRRRGRGGRPVYEGLFLTCS
jgi:hypothetical protein